MPYRYTLSTFLLLVLAVLLSFGCGDTEESGSNAAPASIASSRFEGAVTSGGGAFANTASISLSFGDSQFVIWNDGRSAADMVGSYTYSPDGVLGSATLTIEDPIQGKNDRLFTLEMAFTYTSSFTGTYAVNAGPNGSQAGTFIQEYH